MTDTNENKISMTVSPKTILLSAMMFLGSALGGGGVSVYTNPKQEIVDLKKEMVSLMTETKAVNTSIQSLSQDIVKITTTASSDRKDIDRLQNRYDALETRIRELERTGK